MDLDDFHLLEEYEHSAHDAIMEILRAQRKLIVAYSGGKDSTVMLLMALNAARLLREQGIAFPSILISHGDTGIENPSVVALVRNELRKASAYAKAHGFEAQGHIARPALLDTWAVSVLSGRKLPTFPNSSSRDCTQMYKIRPMELLRSKILKAELEQPRGGPPVTLIGTRFEESSGRGIRMTERGETAYEPWEKSGAFFLSPIANWSSDDVWAYLGSYKNRERLGFTDAVDVWEMYSDAGGAGGACAVVADMATEGVKKSRACGARFGCALCAAVGVDKSMEAMIALPKFSWLSRLNKIQQFIANTAWDWSRRNWVGRTLVEGCLPIGPDTYSPAMLQELLRYCLTADAIEASLARRGEFAPRFELVSQEALIAIDALWSLHGVQARPFTAVKLWKEVYHDRKRFYPPDIGPIARTPIPKTRYLRVGADWDGATPSLLTGLRSGLHETLGGPGCKGVRAIDGEHLVLDIDVGPRFAFNAESVDLFFQFEVESVVENYHDANAGPTAGFFYYAGLGLLETTDAHVRAHLDRIARRASWRHRTGLCGDIDLPALLDRTISRETMAAERTVLTP